MNISEANHGRNFSEGVIGKVRGGISRDIPEELPREISKRSYHESCHGIFSSESSGRTSK